MSLVKWFRKNNTKIMAVVVIVIMAGFIFGAYIRQFSPARLSRRKTVAYFGDNSKITNSDLSLARRDMEVLKMLRADYILRSINLPAFRREDLRAMLLGELLFPERVISPQISMQIKRMIKANGYEISDKQINDIYRRSVPSDIYWLLLKEEARQAGVRISNDSVGGNLAITIPKLFEGAQYQQLIGSIMNREGIAEEKILSTFGELLAILEYARMMCSDEDVTDLQVMHKASWENETIDVEFVKVDSAVFAESAPQPGEEEMIEHFNKYKEFEHGTVSVENPYGFGYKLGQRVRLEYIVVRLDDISEIVGPPTQEQAEEYYQRHKQRFIETVPSDVNDPNSPPIERTQSYAEVAGVISRTMLQDKINSKANAILQEAKTLVDGGLEPENLSAETVGDYEAVAGQLSEKYGIKVYVGQTGLLSADDMANDSNLGMLHLKGYGYNNTVGLIHVVFAIDPLDAAELGPFDVSKPKMYESIGPARDMRGQIMALVRVTEAKKACPPETINQTFSRETIKFDEEKSTGRPTAEEKNVYSVAELVVQDLRKLAAMETTESKAQELLRLVTEKGWEDAVAQFNQIYSTKEQQQSSGDPNLDTTTGQIELDQQPFRLEEFPALRQVPKETIRMWLLHAEGNPAAQFMVNQSRKESLLRDQLYSLIPDDAETLDSVPIVMEFKPGMCYYCVKNISIDRLEQQQYEKIKSIQVYKEDIVRSQSLAAVHFNPENILKRMKFRTPKSEEAADVNAPTQTDSAAQGVL